MTVITERWYSKDTVAVVTGANKGIGYEIVRGLAKAGLTVVLTSRDESRGQAAIKVLKAEGLENVFFHKLEVNSAVSVKVLAEWLKGQFGEIDILVNNAGVNSGPNGLAADYENAKAIVGTNYYGVKNVTAGLLRLLRPEGRIINLSSRLGFYNRLRSERLKKAFSEEVNYSEQLIDSLAEKYLHDVNAGRLDEEGWIADKPVAVPMYSESKIFLNAYSIVLAKSFSDSQDHKIYVATMCPGITVTDMFNRQLKDGFTAPEGFPIKTVEDGADTGVWLALLPKEEIARKNGKFFGERQEWPFGLVNPPL